MSISNSEINHSTNQELDSFTFARDLALRALGPRAKSRLEISNLLSSKNVDSEIVNSVCDDLELHGYLNDLDFANQWVESRRRQKKSSRSVILQELKQKGISAEFINEALATLSSEDEFDLAFQIAERKYRSISQLEPEVIKRRLQGLLMRKGYPFSIALAVIDKLIKESGN